MMKSRHKAKPPTAAQLDVLYLADRTPKVYSGGWGAGGPDVRTCRRLAKMGLLQQVAEHAWQITKKGKEAVS